MQDNVLSFIGLARRAGSLELGADKVYEMASIGKAKLVILADDISLVPLKEFPPFGLLVSMPERSFWSVP